MRPRCLHLCVPMHVCVRVSVCVRVRVLLQWKENTETGRKRAPMGGDPEGNILSLALFFQMPQSKESKGLVYFTTFIFKGKILFLAWI